MSAFLDALKNMQRDANNSYNEARIPKLNTALTLAIAYIEDSEKKGQESKQNENHRI